MLEVGFCAATCRSHGKNKHRHTHTYTCIHVCTYVCMDAKRHLVWLIVFGALVSGHVSMHAYTYAYISLPPSLQSNFQNSDVGPAKCSWFKYLLDFSQPFSFPGKMHRTSVPRASGTISSPAFLRGFGEFGGGPLMPEEVLLCLNERNKCQFNSKTTFQVLGSTSPWG